MSEKTTYRLNQFIAKCGVCTRREADELIKKSLIQVNGQVAREFGLKIDPLMDTVSYESRALTLNQGRFFLFNKPVGMPMTSPSSPEEISAASIVSRKAGALMHPLISLGEQDCGLVLFTDDIHAVAAFSSGLDELIHITLSQGITTSQLESIRNTTNVLEANKAKDCSELGVKVNSELAGKVRGLMESMGFKVSKYDRVMIGNLTKRDLPRAKSRILNAKDLGFLKMRI